MPFGAFVAITIFIFLAIVGGLAGIILEGRRIGAAGHNPATQDTVFPIVGWATLFALHLALLFVRVEDLTPGFKTQLGTLAVLPLFYGVLATAWLIWRSARRIHAAMTGGLPVRWRTIPYLGALRFPILFLAAVVSAALEFSRAEFSYSDALLASIVVLLALIRKPGSLSSDSRSEAPPPGTA
jgi:hypothetical protein